MFSVVIPYYKKIKFIERCLDSVLSQTFKEFEIILVDDGSNDDLKTILALPKYQQKISLITQENQGVSVARNKGIEVSKYNYIAFLDADDSWHSQYLEYVNRVISANSDVKIVGAHYTTDKSRLNQQNELKYSKLENYFKVAIKNTMFATSATVISKRFFTENQGFNPLLRSGQDVDVFFRTILSGGGVFFINNSLMLYSTEDENQLTRLKQSLAIPLHSIFLGNIPKLYYPLYDKIDNQDFKVFISKYIYFNLYKYYYSEQFHASAKEMIKNNRHKFFFLGLVYKMPFFIGSRIIKKPTLSRYIRLYLKFVLRYVYN
ncbi:glycosyltransferase family 2 protein [Flavobacterium sp. SM15]|uniref:glycosyltransferase family 2 protein n=1 Tax=Flavobacterium sp. SM15 TaxID=2908005 RepID=UPI001EDAF81B|nr:glycosyltransferase family A protein [Flavobacterium sp. SM15]MCG2611288.1 glycosyltransferase family 2 protein [Flavobacterium sp. SM15]